MAGAAAPAIAGFTALRSISDYPKIRKELTAEILTHFQTNQGAISAWFLVLAIGPALLANVGSPLRCLAGGRLGRWIAGVGVAAAAVQVIGLSRWVLLIPDISDNAPIPGHLADAQHRFELLHTWLGKALGYALTATFTILVVIAITQVIAPRCMSYLGYASAGLIATGIAIPLGLCALSITNFAGYVAWCLWLIPIAFILRPPIPAPGVTTETSTATRKHIPAAS